MAFAYGITEKRTWIRDAEGQFAATGGAASGGGISSGNQTGMTDADLKAYYRPGKAGDVIYPAQAVFHVDGKITRPAKVLRTDGKQTADIEVIHRSGARTPQTVPFSSILVPRSSTSSARTWYVTTGTMGGPLTAKALDEKVIYVRDAEGQFASTGGGGGSSTPIPPAKRMMGQDVERADSVVGKDDMQYDLYRVQGGQGGMVRVTDIDSGEHTDIRKYPEFARAQAAYNAAIQVATKARTYFPDAPGTDYARDAGFAVPERKPLDVELFLAALEAEVEKQTYVRDAEGQFASTGGGGGGGSAKGFTASVGSTAADNALDREEARMMALKKERVVIVNPRTGGEVDRREGSAHVAGYNRSDVKDNVMLHNHPNEGSFSSLDVSNAIGAGAAETRIVTPSGRVERLTFSPSARQSRALSDSASAQNPSSGGFRGWGQWATTQEGVTYSSGQHRGITKTLEKAHAHGNDRSPEVHAAQQRIHDALARGEIKKPDGCSRCATKGPVEAAHNSYGERLDFKWLCPSCHHEADHASPKSTKVYDYSLYGYAEKHPGHPDQKVHGGAGRGSASAANPIYAAAIANEPAITADMKGFASASGGNLVGLDNAVKGRGSLERKIHDDSVSKHIPLAASSSQISDAVRYTAAFSPGKLAAGANRMRTDMKEKGYTEKKLKNFWKTPPSDGSYHGINSQWIHPGTGQKLELQFHTPESLRIEKRNHPHYERFRAVGASAKVKREARVAMKKNWVGHTVPANIGSVS